MPFRHDGAYGRQRAGAAQRSWIITAILTTVASLGAGAPAALASSTPLSPLDNSGFPRCAWKNITSAARGDVAFPEGNATSWTTYFYARAGLILKIRGRFPYARYMSFTVQPISFPDSGGPPTFDQTSGDHIFDVNIRPDRGSINPFKPGANRLATKRNYSVYIKFQDPDGHAHGNTLYGGSTGFGALIYRVYAPDKGRDAQGGVALPTITKFTYSADGSKPTASRAPQCSLAALNGRGVAQQMASTFARVPALAWYHNASGMASSPIPSTSPSSSEGFFDGFHALVTRLARGTGFFVTRFKAPTFADTYDGAAINGREQVRYWSLCEYQLSTGQLGGCIADYQAHRDKQGYATIVVGDPNLRTRVASTLRAANWLPLRGNAQGILIYRQLLAAPAFAQSVERAPSSAASMRARLGIYYPALTSCSLSGWMQNRCSR